MTLDKCSECKHLKAERLRGNTNYSWLCAYIKQERPKPIRNIDTCPAWNR